MLKERGLEDLSLVVCDPWSVHLAPDDLATCKLIQLFMYFRTEPNDNHYAHPLDFTPIVDLYQKKARARREAPCSVQWSRPWRSCSGSCRVDSVVSASCQRT
jgi:Cu2+-containing amine oxidase